MMGFPWSSISIQIAILVERSAILGPCESFLEEIFLLHLLNLKLIAANQEHVWSLTSTGRDVAKYLLKLPYHQHIVEFLRPGQVFHGAKWVEGRDVKETANLIRQEIALCIGRGILPRGKCHVRSHKKYYRREHLHHRAIYTSLSVSGQDNNEISHNNIESICGGLLQQYNMREEGL